MYVHTHTSDFSENWRCEIASGAIHLSGNLLAFLVDWYISSASLDRPKSVTFSNLLQLTRTFLHAKSRWIMLMLERYSCGWQEDNTALNLFRHRWEWSTSTSYHARGNLICKRWGVLISKALKVNIVPVNRNFCLFTDFRRVTGLLWLPQRS